MTSTIPQVMVLMQRFCRQFPPLYHCIASMLCAGPVTITTDVREKKENAAEYMATHVLQH